jgi:2-polyprenyl-3-methyl-5-hydroxy-6-metoxy-1,4-benzoquinol methylase
MLRTKKPKPIDTVIGGRGSAMVHGTLDETRQQGIIPYCAAAGSALGLPQSSIDVCVAGDAGMAKLDSYQDALERSHRLEVRSGARFEFGKNWSRFLANLTVRRIKLAEESLRTLLDVTHLGGKTFLDIGSGSGLFSLAARRLGATVRSFDYDPRSVACTRELRRRYFDDDANWRVEQGSVLDRDYLGSLGTFDIVYSWGVLHHTGQMWAALDNVKPLVPIGGKLFIAIYNDLGPVTDQWARIKQTYCALPKPIAFAYALRIIGREEWKEFSSHRRNGSVNQWVRTWTQYAEFSTRGMSRWHDWIDWVGGYPYERTKLEPLVDFYARDGFQLTNLVDRSTGYGNNELVFTRKEPAGVFVPGGTALARMSGAKSFSGAVPFETALAGQYGLPVKGPFVCDAEGWKAKLDFDLDSASEDTVFLVYNDIVTEPLFGTDGQLIVAAPDAARRQVSSTEFFLIRGRMRVLVPPFEHVRGKMWKGHVPEFMKLCERDAQRPSPLFLFENGRQLPRPHAPHAEVAAHGDGRFSHWDEDIWFSALDGSDPNHNGRQYSVILAKPDFRDFPSGRDHRTPS